MANREAVIQTERHLFGSFWLAHPTDHIESENDEVLQMSYSLRFELPGLPEAYNVLMRMHFRPRSVHNNKWMRDVSMMTTGKRPPEPLKTAKITLTRFSSVRPDSDNLRGSFKCIIDALTVCGVIEDDKFENVGEPVVLWEKASPGKGRILVEVEG